MYRVSVWEGDIFTSESDSENDDRKTKIYFTLLSIENGQDGKFTRIYVCVYVCIYMHIYITYFVYVIDILIYNFN